MSGMSDLDLERRDCGGGDDFSDDGGSREAIAALLGGDVDEKGRVCCPSIGEGAVDRSCVIKIDPARPNEFYIYDCEGSKGANYAAIREKLKLVAPITGANSASFALKLWGETAPAAGTVVERYLRGRGLTCPIPPVLRFHPRLWHRNGGAHWPAMIGARTDVAGRIVAVHRTYLTFEGKKAPVGDKVKMDLGPCRGTCIRLSPVANELLIAEGIENALSGMVATGRPGWAAGSAAALRRAELPLEVRRITFLSDGDAASAGAERMCTAMWRSEGREVRIARPPAGKDFNDVLLEEIGQ
jgi:putative DNA primase/helicase